MMKQQIDTPNENEIGWIEAQIENARKFVEGFSPEDAKRPLTLGALDRAFAAWTGSGPTDLHLINAIINYVGIAFGQALVDGLGLKWVIATDEQGSDLAVYGMPERGDILVYPVNLIAKRWEGHETKFLEDAYARIAGDLRSVFREWNRS